MRIYLLLKGYFKDIGTNEVWRKRKAAVPWQYHPTRAAPSHWLCYTGFLVDGRPQPMMFNRHWSTLQDKEGHEELHPWSCLRAAARTRPNASTTAALHCTMSSYTLRRCCPLDQQALVRHSKTLTSDKKDTGTCVWEQGTLYFSKSSPPDWQNCALLQLLVNQVCCRKKRSLDFHESLFLKHLQQCWQILSPQFMNCCSVILMPPREMLVYMGVFLTEKLYLKSHPNMGL